MNEENTTMPNLRDFLLKRRLNLTHKNLDQLNNKWYDEIYAFKKNDPFKCYKDCKWKSNLIPAPIPVSNPVPITTPKTIPIKSQSLINNLETEISDLRFRLLTLSLINIGLIIININN